MATASFRRYVPSIAAVLVTALCVTAGNWQRSRMHEKQSLRAQHDAAIATPPLAGNDLPREPTAWEALRYRPVILEGEFDAPHQILLDNRVQGGQVGYEVLTPLRLSDGRLVLIDRGWVSQGRTRAEVPAVAVPAGPVVVQGRIDLPPKRYFEMGSGAPRGNVWQHLDVGRLENAWGVTLLPVAVDQIAPVGPSDALLRAWPEPDFGIDTHRIYMVQWYAFAALTVIFWAVAHRPRRWRRNVPMQEGSDG